MPDPTGGLSLREQLGSKPDPDFEIKLPVGWERRTPTQDDREQLSRELRERLLTAQRPEIYARLSSLLNESYDAMQKQGAIAFYAPTRASATTMVPGSLIASIVRPPAGGSLDELVRHAVTQYGATPLLGDKRFIRFERERTTAIEGESITQTSITYLTPVPGSGRRRALQFIATYARPPETPAEDETVRMYAATFDLMVSTLRWRAPATS